MKSLISMALLALCFLMSCKQESTLSELEQRKQELESKKQLLQDKKALAALEEEMKSVDAEIKTVSKKEQPVAAVPSARTGTITGGNVVMRGSNTIQAEKIANFNKGEKVTILNQSSGSAGNEAIANRDIPLYKNPGSGEFAYTLPKGKAVIIESYNAADAQYNVYYQHPDLGKLYAVVPSSALDPISGELWYFVRRSNGLTGWVIGRFLAEN